MSICRDNQRKKKLESAIKGDWHLCQDIDTVTPEDLYTLAESTLEKVRTEFDEFIEEREEHIREVANECEARALAANHMELNELKDDTHLLLGVRRTIHQCLSSTRPHTEVAVQTDGEKKTTWSGDGDAPVTRSRSTVCSTGGRQR